MFNLSLFGGFQLIHQDQTVALDHRPRVQSLLAYLALHRDQPQTRVAIIHALWPDVAEASGRNRLRNLLYQLRQILPDCDTLLHIEPATLQWRSDAPADLDVARFEAQLTMAAQQHSADQRESALADAVERYAGDLFPTCIDEWIEPPRTRLHNQLLDALGQLVSLAEAREAWDVALHYAERLLVHDPLHEATYGHIMQFHARLGDGAGVVRTYERCYEH